MQPTAHTTPDTATKTTADHQIHLFAYMTASADHIRFLLTGVQIHGRGGVISEALMTAAARRGLSAMTLLEAMKYGEYAWGK